MVTYLFSAALELYYIQWLIINKETHTLTHLDIYVVTLKKLK